MAYMISANMDQGFKDFQIEAAISKIYASVSEYFSASGPEVIKVFHAELKISNPHKMVNSEIAQIY